VRSHKRYQVMNGEHEIRDGGSLTPGILSQIVYVDSQLVDVGALLPNRMNKAVQRLGKRFMALGQLFEPFGQFLVLLSNRMNEALQRLSKRFMALGQLFEPFINVHLSSILTDYPVQIILRKSDN